MSEDNAAPEQSPVGKMLDDIMEQPVVGEAAEEIGNNLLSALIDELALIPHPSVANQSVWSTMKERDQENVVDRLTRRIKTEVFAGYRVILAGGNPAARATLEKVVFSDKGIQGTLAIDKNSSERHALADYAGAEVAIIMPADIKEFLEMDQIHTQPDQADLDLGETGEVSGDGTGEALPEAEGPCFLCGEDPCACTENANAAAEANAAEGDGADVATAEPDDVPEELDPNDLSVTDLVRFCSEIAADIGEDDLTEEVFGKYDKAHLVDYLTYARKKRDSEQGD